MTDIPNREARSCASFFGAPGMQGGPAQRRKSFTQPIRGQGWLNVGCHTARYGGNQVEGQAPARRAATPWEAREPDEEAIVAVCDYRPSHAVELPFNRFVAAVIRIRRLTGA